MAEFKVETSTYWAEFGRSASGLVNVASRRGSNAFHGVVDEFLRSHVTRFCSPWVRAKLTLFSTRQIRRPYANHTSRYELGI